MLISPRALLSPVLTAILLLAAAGSVQAAPTSAQSASSHTSRIVVAITTTGGTVWGKVSIHYTSHGHASNRACSASSCTLHVPRGIKLHLSQSATNTATWPFEKWQIKAGQSRRDLMGMHASVKVKGNMSITAVYILKQSKGAASQPTQPGYNYPP